MTTGNIADDILPTIADQIKHGIGNLADETPEVQIDIAELYYFAGIQSAASSDHAASRSYLTYALSLLPTDRWKSQYDLSLRFSLQLAKSCNSCGDIEKTQCILQEITEQCHSIEDKLPALALLAAGKSHLLCRRFLRDSLPDCCLLRGIFSCPSSYFRKKNLGSIHSLPQGLIPTRGGNTGIIATRPNNRND